GAGLAVGPEGTRAGNPQSALHCASRIPYPTSRTRTHTPPPPSRPSAPPSRGLPQPLRTAACPRSPAHRAPGPSARTGSSRRAAASPHRRTPRGRGCQSIRRIATPPWAWRRRARSLLARPRAPGPALRGGPAGLRGTQSPAAAGAPVPLKAGH
ncbi:hypothetical protein Nmel_013053, partial [Mimus melanotis]